MLRRFKKMCEKEGLTKDIKRVAYYEKPSERKAREKGEAVRRARKLVRKRAQREGLLPASPPRRAAGAGRGPGGPRPPSSRSSGE